MEAETEGRGIAWALATPVVAVLVALIPLVFNSRFYFYDDTQIGAYPIWYEIGQQLRSGVWPVFSTEGWQAGNYAAEGQWGIFSVLTMGIGLASTAVPDAVLFSTGVKLLFLAVAAIGFFLVARSYGATAPLAFAAGVSSVLAGFTVYLDSPSWVTGLMVWSLLPLVWWALRRMTARPASPLPALLFGYLLITVGYVHGTIMLVLLMLALLLEAVVVRNWRALRRLLLAGVVFGLIALAVYLPGVLTLSATSRKTVVDNTNFLTVDLTGIAGSALASASPQVGSWWWGPFAPVPLTYIAWFLPLFALVDFGRLRRLLADRVALPAFLVLSALLVLAPSDLGPLRTPVRLMPYLSVAVILLFFVALSRARVPRPGLARWAVVAGLFVFSAYLGWTGDPDGWKVSGLVSAVMVVGFVLVLLAGRLRRPGAWGAAVAATLIVVSAGLAFVQHRYFPNPPVQDFLLSASVEDYQRQLSDAKGQTVVVGAPAALRDAAWDESLVGNSWYLNEHRVHNLYSPTQNAAYAADLCMSSRGETCPELITKLFELDPTTGLPLADLLRVDSVQVVRAAEAPVGSPLDPATVPQGWSVAAEGDDTALITRDAPLGDVGAPVWSTPGSSLELVSNTNDEVRFRVTSAPESGADVVLSRIDWPGYRAEGAQLTDSLRGYLLTVHVDADSVGDTVTVRFTPPGWTLELGALALAALLGLSWIVVDLVTRLRSRGNRRTGDLEAQKGANARDARSDDADEPASADADPRGRESGDRADAPA